MQIRHLSFSTTGGAGRVAVMLSNKQEQMGHDSKVLNAISGSLWSNPLSRPLTTLTAAIDNYIVSNKSKDTLFGLFRDESSLNLNLQDLAVGQVHLHWTKGVISQDSITKLSEISMHPIVWTLHDMSAFTGGCHHAGECPGFQNECADCPQVRNPFKSKVSLALQKKKDSRYLVEKMIFVAPSEWMRKTAQKSSLLKNARVETIENPVDEAFLSTGGRDEARKILGIDSFDLVGLVIATDLADPNKGVQKFVDDFTSAATALGRNSSVIIIGRNPDRIHSSGSRIISTGPQSSNYIALVGPAADVLGLYSSAETAPLVMAEAAFMGMPAVFRTNNHGAKSISRILETGFEVETIDDLVGCLKVISSADYSVHQELSKRNALRIFSAEKSASKYCEIYGESDSKWLI